MQPRILPGNVFCPVICQRILPKTGHIGQHGVLDFENDAEVLVVFVLHRLNQRILILEEKFFANDEVLVSEMRDVGGI